MAAPDGASNEQRLDQAVPSASAPAGSRVLLYAPNLVGYVRVILLLASAAVMSSHPRVCLSLYLANIVLDAVDGALARALGQV